jgi:hypothetical protein
MIKKKPHLIFTSLFFFTYCHLFKKLLQKKNYFICNLYQCLIICLILSLIIFKLKIPQLILSGKPEVIFGIILLLLIVVIKQNVIIVVGKSTF